MIYQEAIKQLLAGKYVSRPAWKDANGYLAYLPGLVHLLHVTTQPKAQVVPWAADIESSSADDWEVTDAVLKVVEPVAEPIAA